MIVLTRIKRGVDGIFGILTDDSNDHVFGCTLEHAYSILPDRFTPKIPVGVYPCILGSHRLLGMSKSFDTYAVCGVPGHSGILFHPGNTNLDSSGCILLGREIAGLEPNRFITHSKEVFDEFMNYMTGNFQLKVENKYDS